VRHPTRHSFHSLELSVKTGLLGAFQELVGTDNELISSPRMGRSNRRQACFFGLSPRNGACRKRTRHAKPCRHVQ
jgi:hypothetical protein